MADLNGRDLVYAASSHFKVGTSVIFKRVIWEGNKIRLFEFTVDIYAAAYVTHLN